VNCDIEQELPRHAHRREIVERSLTELPLSVSFSGSKVQTITLPDLVSGVSILPEADLLFIWTFGVQLEQLPLALIFGSWA
jgi:hypothetical protein